MSHVNEYKRPQCLTCLRPHSTCICQWITPTTSLVQVLILQHPLEVFQAKGSARLLHLSLMNSQLVVGETFQPDSLHAILYSDDKLPVLLYPETPEMKTLDCGLSVSPESWQLKNCGRIRLVVLDATWRKSRKMLYLNPLLQSLPRIGLQPLTASCYHIRKAQKPHQLSSLEATCLALAQVEQHPEKYSALLKSFEGFVTQQLANKTRKRWQESAE